MHDVMFWTLFDELHKHFKTNLDVSTWHIDVASVTAVFDTARREFHLEVDKTACAAAERDLAAYLQSHV